VPRRSVLGAVGCGAAPPARGEVPAGLFGAGAWLGLPHQEAAPDVAHLLRTDQESAANAGLEEMVTAQQHQNRLTCP
jgi:hypothetical protein